MILELQFFSIKTPLFKPPKFDIYPVLDECVTELKDGDILFITTKILSIHQGNCLPIEKHNKDDLSKECASHFTERDVTAAYPVLLTITQGCLMLSAGIDESNANGYFILWPTNTGKLLMEIRTFLMEKFNIKHLGVVATDSKCNPLQLGVSGMVVACCGFEPIKTYIGHKDLFDRPFITTNANIAQSLSATAVFVMGEGTEQTPMAIYRNKNLKNKINYTNSITTEKSLCPLENDIFAPILQPFFKKKST
ncbi:MAG: coenzyme F420-0:L-glutamate ligase [Alphaproteobacteria bacterium]|nr:coenzyme F420-0:L-glutamate ligase [Rickettsiales bacterium]